MIDNTSPFLAPNKSLEIPLEAIANRVVNIEENEEAECSSSRHLIMGTMQPNCRDSYKGNGTKAQAVGE